MCLILFAYKYHPKYKIIIGANRDEFYNRPTTKAHFWKNYPDILAGQDLVAKGTWMGVSRNGKLSLITNYRDIKNIKPNAPSRGHIVSDYLKKDVSPKDYLEQVDSIGHVYNGFNLILGNQDDLWYYSNQKRKIYRLGSGLYGLSNALLDTTWPKVEKGKQKLEVIIAENNISAEAIFDALFDDQTAADRDLPKTGLDYEREKALSSMLIKTSDYGTRCSTVLLIDNENNLTFIERTFNLQDFGYQSKSFEFPILTK